MVWEAVRQIPHGQVATYGQIASLTPAPIKINESAYKAFGARWVGGAMRSCPSDVPWHRVVNSKGKISIPGDNASKQRQILESEGVTFDTNGRIDLNKFQWKRKKPDDPQLRMQF